MPFFSYHLLLFPSNRLPETELYTREVVMQYPSLPTRFKNILKTVRLNWVKLLGTAGSWFLLDIVFYGHSLFSSDVTHAMNTRDSLQDKTVTNLWIQIMAMPGYICAIIFIDKIGRKKLQIFGFTGR